MYQTRIARSVEDLSPGTADLAARAGVSEFYYGHEFLRGYEREPIQPVHDVYYIETFDDMDRVVGLTPCYVQGDPLRALGVAEGELSLLSHVWHCSDTNLAAVDSNAEIARVVLAAMRKIATAAKLPRFGFINVPDSSPTAAALTAAGLAGFPLDTRYYLDLAALGDWDGYLATMSSKNRREYRRHLRRGDDCGVKVVERPAGAGEDPRTLRIFEETMARVGSAGYYSAERIAAFLAYTPRGARVIDVVLGDDVVAKVIVFVETRKIHAWALGYDRDRPLPFSPYYVAIAAIIQLGFQLGLPRLEMGRRNAKFKERFGMPAQQLSAFMADA